MKTVKKAIIPAAGLGTRFLPASKSVPKEMLPIVDRPIILHIVEEAVRAGIEDIVIVSGRGKSAIEDFFDASYELEDLLAKSGKEDLLKTIVDIKNMANIISVRQKEALGLGHAVLCAESIVGDEPFSVLLGDEVMMTPDHKPTVTGQLINLYGETGLSAVAVMEVLSEQVSKYGIIAHEPSTNSRYKVTSVVEKPSLSEAPSRLALPGRYVFTANIFNEIKSCSPGVNGEIQLTDAMTSLVKKSGMIATLFDAKRFDAGDKFGFLQANIEFALQDKNIGPQLKPYLKSLAETL